MRIGNKLFPYPILNSNEELSDYASGMSFSLAFNTDENGCPVVNEKELVLPNLHYELECPAIETLIEDGSAEVALIIECSSTLYRERIELLPGSVDLRLPLSDFSGGVNLSCFVYATESIEDFSCDGLSSEFEGMTFEIEKYDILAADDGVSFNVNLDLTDDNKIASIFTVVKIEDEDLQRISYENGEKGINIRVPSKFYDCYDNLKMHASYNNIAFAMMAIPVLSSCLEEIKHGDYEDIDDVVADKQWFISVCFGYKRTVGSELDFQTFLSMNSFDLAQMVLNDASCKGIYDFNEFLLGNQSADQEESEAENE